MDNFDDFRKLLIDSNKNFESCALAVNMTTHGLRKAIRNHTLPREKIVLLARHLGLYEQALADIVSPTPLQALSAIDGGKHVALRPITATQSYGQFMDWLYQQRGELEKFMMENRRNE